MLTSTKRDPSLNRILACAMTELALGEDREKAAFRFFSVAVALLADLDRGGCDSRTVIQRLRRAADQLEG